MRIAALAFALAVLVACDTLGDGTSHDALRDSKSGLPGVKLVDAFPRLEFDRPVWITTPEDDTKRLFVLEQDGRVRVFKPDAATSKAEVFLDISKRVFRGHNEEGLLCLAFHPKYRENGFFYVWYSANQPRRHVLSRFSASKSDPDKADPASEKILLEIEKPYGNHDGSTLLFGPDGFLYFSVGDGGAAGDPFKNGQNLDSWLAKIHRIDVDHQDGKKPYAVPKDNPFAGQAGAKPETWAYGLRNVWRMSFDREKKTLWAGDVGQDKWEEVDIIEKGGNYGWRVREGLHPFQNDPAKGTLIDPVIEYNHKEGQSITGGYVYRGKALKKLAGAYVYADYVTGSIYALRYDEKSKKVTEWKEIADQPKNIASFGEDGDGELYVCCFDGKIYRLSEE